MINTVMHPKMTHTCFVVCGSRGIVGFNQAGL
jgi:hypothetical protein